jgi:hypothetical protein
MKKNVMSFCALLVMLTGCDGGNPMEDAGDRADAAGDAGSIEELDAGADAGSDAGSDAGQAPTYNIAFVTSTRHTGALGGLAGADEICAMRASSAGLEGTFVALLSTDTVDAIDRLGTASGWVRTDGRPFALTREDLAAGRLMYPLRLDENGADAEGWSSFVWTGTEPDLSAPDMDDDCQDWTSGAMEDRAIGGFLSAAKEWWLNGNYGLCHGENQFYCLGVDHDEPVPAPTETGRVAFVTELTFSSGDGREAADALCAMEAQAAGLTGVFLALLADVGESASARFSTTGATWVRVDGVRVAPSPTVMFAGPIWEAPLNVTADGEHVRPDSIWNGSGGADLNAAGTAASTCSGWTSTDASASATTGWPSSTLSQTVGFGIGGGYPCTSSTRLICLEQ